MFRKCLWAYICLFVLVFIGKTFGQNNDTNTTVKPKIDIFGNYICKRKCNCKTDGVTNELDCTRKLNAWFTADDWLTLQNGDKIFETIILEHNNFTSVPVLPAYPVKNLYLGFNQIDTIAIEAFQNLTQLSRLDLSHNALTAKSLNPEIFKGLYTPTEDYPLGVLKDLNLSHNEIHTLNGDVFQHIPDLQSLTLSQNVMRSIDASTEVALNSLLELKLLDISYMELKSIPPSIFNTNKKLETLIIAGNILKTIPEHLELAEGLVHLNIDDNPISSLGGDNIFPKMKNLKTLSISYMEYLITLDNGSFANLDNLNILYASDNEKLSSIDSEAFSKDTIYLKEVYLNNNNLSVFERSWFTRWDQIEVFDLRLNPWACNCVNNFLVEIIVPQINSTKPNYLQNVNCGTPKKLKDVPLLTLAVNKSDLPCEPSTRNIALACMIVFTLVVLPLLIGSVVLYRRGCFGIRNHFNRRNERALYSRATFTDDFHI